MDYFSLILPKNNPKLYQQSQRYFIKKHVIEALEQALMRRSHAAPILKKYFRQTRSLGSKDRRRVADMVYTIIRCSDVFSHLGMQTPIEWYSIYQDFLHGNSISIDEDRNTIDIFSLCTGIPQQLCSNLYEQFAENRSDFILWTHSLPPTYIRVCLDKINRVDLQQKLKNSGIISKPIPQVPMTLQIQGRANLIAHPLYKKGYFEIQDLSSQRFCSQIDVQGKHVFDVCAGSGGKSLAFASQGGTVFAHDIRTNALQELQKRAQRGGYKVRQRKPTSADIIVIDAPCSGTGRLAREPTLRWKYKDWDPLSFVATQKELIQHYKKMLTDENKILFYATCSLLQEENEHQIEDLHQNEKVWCWPHQNLGDGFFWSSYKSL